MTNTTKTTLACCLFEGFMDFLSYLTLVKQGKLPPPCRQPDLIVLNSVNNLSKALSRLKAYKKIYCFLDNDDAGRKAVDLLREMNTATVYNVMEAFPYYKDVNDLLRDKKGCRELTLNKRIMSYTSLCAGYFVFLPNN